jgi:hypothetical protein
MTRKPSDLVTPLRTGGLIRRGGPLAGFESPFTLVKIGSSMHADAPASSPRREDPVLKSARREALIVFATWIVALTYTIGYSARFGYGRKLEDLHFILGFPDWVFWGIVVPWGVCVVFSWFFASVLMTDEDLGEDPPGTEANPTALADQEIQDAPSC